MKIRYEHKFLVPRLHIPILLSYLEGLAFKDPHSDSKGEYHVLSKYFDTKDLSFYSQKLEGEFDHLKIRQRTYTKDFLNENYFFEAKLKSNRVTYKERLSATDFYCKSRNKNSFLDTIFITKNLFPVCQIYYRRRALTLETSTDNLRITIDFNIKVVKMSEKVTNLMNCSSRDLISKDHFLLEIKSNSYKIPLFLKNILTSIKAKKVRISKYALGIEKLKRLGDY